MTQEEGAVVLVSGGIDSATCLGVACASYGEIHPVHIQYGQQTAEVEEAMARRQVQHFREERDDPLIGPMEIIDYSSVFRHFAEGVANPEKTFEQQTEEDGRSSGYVPMRNLHLIATAAAIADVRDAQVVYHGAQSGDGADYPDCRQTFIDSAAGAITKSVPDNKTIGLRVPLITREKFEVVKIADTVGVDFEAAYSCYREVGDPENPEPCEECPACIERMEAFNLAGIEDPIMEK